MKVGIIVHSHSGNTLSVAEKLKEVLIKAGHAVNLERVNAVNEDPNKLNDIQLEHNPDLNGYDVLIFGAPVWAFSLSRIMNYFLTNQTNLTGKSISCFVTEQLPVPWMGGNHAVKQMKTICASKGGKITKTGVVNWSSKKREQKIAKLVADFSSLT